MLFVLEFGSARVTSARYRGLYNCFGLESQTRNHDQSPDFKQMYPIVWALYPSNWVRKGLHGVPGIVLVLNDVDERKNATSANQRSTINDKKWKIGVVPD